MFPSIANVRLVREATTVMCYKKWWKQEWQNGTSNPIFKSQQYWGVRENPQVLEGGYYYPLKARINFPPWAQLR